MPMMLHTIAVDLGASSGKLFRCSFDGRRLKAENCARFPNRPLSADGHIYWDTPGLFEAIKHGVRYACRNDSAASLSIDSFGQDFALLSNGAALGYIRHYRDASNAQAMDLVRARMSSEKIFKTTGAKPYSGASLVQLLQMLQTQKDADMLLFTPDYYQYLLSGVTATEPTIASTSMMLEGSLWSASILSAFDIGRYLPPVVETGTVLGPSVCEDLPGSMQVITGAGHDTAAAVATMPDPNAVFLVCGTWSLMGVCTDRTITSDDAFLMGFTNQRAANGQNRFMKSFSALWILQQCEKEFGIVPSESVALAKRAKPFLRFIDPLSEHFFLTDNMPKRIQQFLRATGQPVCEEIGDYVRCILESIALTYRLIFEQLQAVTKTQYDTIYMLGGGVNNDLLCRFAADATGRLLIGGSPDSSAAGNGLVQLKALGVITFKDFADIASRSFDYKEYPPQNSSDWEEPYAAFVEICRRASLSRLPLPQAPTDKDNIHGGKNLI